MAGERTRREMIRLAAGLSGAGLAVAALPTLPAWAQEATGSSGQTGGRPENRIARVVAYPIVAPCRIEVGSYARDTQMGGTLVEVTTQDGLIGHGFTSIADPQIVAAAVNLTAAPALIGQDALARGAVSAQLQELLTPRGRKGASD